MFDLLKTTWRRSQIAHATWNEECESFVATDSACALLECEEKSTTFITIVSNLNIEQFSFSFLSISIFIEGRKINAIQCYSIVPIFSILSHVSKSYYSLLVMAIESDTIRSTFLPQIEREKKTVTLKSDKKPIANFIPEMIDAKNMPLNNVFLFLCVSVGPNEF